MNINTVAQSAQPIINDHRRICLNVGCVQQNGYLGLRCLGPKGRYLQARKRAPHRLCFFSDHWGIWEQWEVCHACRSSSRPAETHIYVSVP